MLTAASQLFQLRHRHCSEDHQGDSLSAATSDNYLAIDLVYTDGGKIVSDHLTQ